ncbi:hypothetical protein FSARC_10574 [Fusarium sarcochroum]|uniref:Zn(2)-C6 fungal-type domain-containing protein n=1 Tax=Fusarium sarcochroum TaxID=1208366 RepID=A0A8H4TL31_9HYPO|nr:hypothetical protein FSARC_10574 [Fusarium sarcochroum]
MRSAAQCSSGETPCPRCLRLGLSCTRDRPAPARGRPRKNQAKAPNGRRASIPVSVSTTAILSSDPGDQAPSGPLDSVTDFLLASVDLPISRSLAGSLLDRVLDVAHCVGILSAFRRQHHQQLGRQDSQAISYTDREDELSFVASRSILCALLACGATFLQGEFPETLSEDCRIYALSDIPILTWKSRDVSRSDAYCLFLLSNLGYLQKDTTEMAARWAMLSEMLAFTALQSVVQPVSSSGPIELDRRINSLVALNAEMQKILYNRPSPDQKLDAEYLASWSYTSQDNEAALQIPTVPDTEWHQSGPCSQNNTPSAGPLGQGFFDLFLPLQKYLRAAMANPRQDNLSQSHVADGLEAYFFVFPTSIMEFVDVSLPWQLEAMVWFHGIYLLLTCGPDFVDVMVDSNLANRAAFPHAVDHAILLGEILPFLLKTESTVLQVMPLTIFFMALSAAVHVGVLQCFFNGVAAPQMLLESATRHKDILDVILKAGKTCDHPSIQSVMTALSSVLSSQSDGSTVEVEQVLSYLEELQYYRWTPGGRGLLPLDQVSAQGLLQSSLACFNSDPLILELSPDLQTVLNPSFRINKPGTFDLSILY